jgi:hypothetical protein
VPLIEEDAVDDPLDGLVDRRVVENDVRSLAAQLERQLLVRAGDRPGDVAPHAGRTGERDLVDAGVTHQRGAGGTRPGDDVHDTGGQIRLLQDLGEDQRRERRRLGRLEDDRVPGGESRCDLPREHEQREVPRDHLSGDAERLRVRAEPRMIELVGPPCVVEEPRGHEGHIDVAALLDRLPVVEALRHRQFPRALLHEASDAEQVLAAVAAAHPRPGLVIGATRSGDRAIDVLVAGRGDLGDVLLGGR